MSRGEHRRGEARRYDVICNRGEVAQATYCMYSEGAELSAVGRAWLGLGEVSQETMYLGRDVTIELGGGHEGEADSKPRAGVAGGRRDRVLQCQQ